MTQFVPPANRGATTRVPAAPYGSTLAQQQVPARPVIRAQRPDDPLPAERPQQAATRPAPITIPSPEELGLGNSTPRESAPLDWADVHNKLDRMGASCFHIEKRSNGSCRITCLLRTGQQGRSRHIEAEGPDEAEAVRATLAEAEEWTSKR